MGDAPGGPGSTGTASGRRVDLVTVGASAGGVATLVDLVERLPHTLGAPVLVVLHIPSSGASVLADILGRRTTTPVVRASDGETLYEALTVVKGAAPPDEDDIELTDVDIAR
jgi:chemotaxis response regulator CheB